MRANLDDPPFPIPTVTDADRHYRCMRGMASGLEMCDEIVKENNLLHRSFTIKNQESLDVSGFVWCNEERLRILAERGHLTQCDSTHKTIAECWKLFSWVCRSETNLHIPCAFALIDGEDGNCIAGCLGFIKGWMEDLVTGEYPELVRCAARDNPGINIVKIHDVFLLKFKTFNLPRLRSRALGQQEIERSLDIQRQDGSNHLVWSSGTSNLDKFGATITTAFNESYHNWMIMMDAFHRDTNPKVFPAMIKFWNMINQFAISAPVHDDYDHERTLNTIHSFIHSFINSQ